MIEKPLEAAFMAYATKPQQFQKYPPPPPIAELTGFSETCIGEFPNETVSPIAMQCCAKNVGLNQQGTTLMHKQIGMAFAASLAMTGMVFAQDLENAQPVGKWTGPFAGGQFDQLIYKESGTYINSPVLVEEIREEPSILTAQTRIWSDSLDMTTRLPITS